MSNINWKTEVEFGASFGDKLNKPPLRNTIINKMRFLGDVTYILLRLQKSF